MKHYHWQKRRNTPIYDLVVNPHPTSSRWKFVIGSIEIFNPCSDHPHLGYHLSTDRFHNADDLREVLRKMDKLQETL